MECKQPLSKSKLFLSFLFGLLLLLTLYVSSFSLISAAGFLKNFSVDHEQVSFNFNEVIDAISINNILSHVYNFSSFGTRVTGTEGCNQAASYIYNYLKSLPNVSVIKQEYNITVPVDEGASITLLNKGREIIKAYPLWPNLVQASPTPPEGLEGRLVYVGNGDYADFNKKFSPGDIVLMEFNTGNNWQKAAELGAKAVIFIEPSTTNYFQELAKFSQTPVYFPRLLVSAVDGMRLKELSQASDGLIVNVKSNIRYKVVKAENIIGVIKGKPGNPTNLTGVDEEIIMVGAHYDSWSVVPAIAPGADESTGVATLLELARYFSEHPPKRTIWFVALSGHWEALAGAREFTEKYYFSPEIQNGTKVAWMFINLDFSTDSNKVGLVFVGDMYTLGPGPEMYWVLPKYDTWINPRVQNYLQQMENQLGKPFTRLVENSLRADWWWATIPTPYILDSEPITVAGGAGFSLRTTDTYRFNWGMLDTPEKVNRENLEPQVQLAACLVYGFSNDPEIPSASNLKSMLAPQRLYIRGSVATGAGFNTLVGKVWTYNISKGWYDSVPNALVVVKTAQFCMPIYPFAKIIQYADSNGSFEIHGLGPGLTSGTGQWQRVLQGYYVEAFHIDNNSGLIDYAPDFGLYGLQSFSFFPLMSSIPTSITTVVFKCSPVEIFNFVDPRTLEPNTLPDPRRSGSIRVAGSEAGYPGVYYSNPWSISMYEAYTQSPLNQFGYYYNPQETIIMFFLPLNTSVAITYRSGVLSELGVLFINTSLQNPEGYGYKVEAKKIIRIVNTPLQLSRDLLSVTSFRYTKLKEKFIRSVISDEALKKAEKFLQDSEEAFKSKDYSKSHMMAVSAWLEVLRGYKDTMNLIYDVARAVVIFSSLLFLFTLFFEPLVFSYLGFKRLASSLLVAGTLIVVFYLLHPGINVISSSIMSLVGVTIGGFFVGVLALFLSRTLEMVRKHRLELLGLHFEKESTVGSLMSTWASVSVFNLRKRKIRTTLILFSVSVITFSLTSFTSTSPSNIPLPISIPWNREAYGNVPYTGLYVTKVGTEMNQIQNLFTTEIAEYVKANLPDAYVSRRVWLYPPSSLVSGGAAIVTGFISTLAEDKQYQIKAIAGFDPEELNIGIINHSLIIEGSWFNESDYASCIITKQVADSLNVHTGDYVKWGGIILKVKGILNETMLNRIVDLDTKSMAPWNPDYITTIRLAPSAQGMQEQYIPVSWQQVLIVPSRLALDLGGYVRSVAVKYDNYTKIKSLAESMALTLSVSVYVSSGNDIKYYSSYTFYNLQGFGVVIIPMIIGSLVILSTMLGALSERVPEIKIYSALGLSPSGVASQFLVESLVIASIGSMMGYLAGLAANGFLTLTNALPLNYTMNTSGLSVLLSIGFSFLAVILSALYPAYSASRLVTPSLERKWKPPTEPVGDNWDIPLPFSLTDSIEVRGVLKYLAEYFRAFLNSTVETFILREVELKETENTLFMKVDLAPVEAHLSQEVLLVATKEIDHHNFYLHIKRTSGSRIPWRSSNLAFIDTIRKQMLMWRTLSSEERRRYTGS